MSARLAPKLHTSAQPTASLQVLGSFGHIIPPSTRICSCTPWCKHAASLPRFDEPASISQFRLNYQNLCQCLRRGSTYHMILKGFSSHESWFLILGAWSQSSQWSLVRRWRGSVYVYFRDFRISIQFHRSHRLELWHGIRTHVTQLTSSYKLLCDFLMTKLLILSQPCVWRAILSSCPE